MGGKFVIVDNPVTTINQATETNYVNEWVTDPSKKLSQKMIQEHTVSNQNLNLSLIHI